MNSLLNKNETPNFEKVKVLDKDEKIYIDFSAISMNDFMNETIVDDMKQILNYLDEKPEVKALVIQGLNNDLPSELLIPSPDFFRKWEKVLNQIQRLSIIKVAVIDGECSGFNLQIALICDYRIGSKLSYFVGTEVKNGFLPGMASLSLVKYIGTGLARKTILDGKPLEADVAFATGLLDYICDVENFESNVVTFIDDMLPNYPEAYHLGSRLISEVNASSYEVTLGHFLAAQNKCLENCTVEKV